MDILAAALAGLAYGSFLNVVATRTLAEESVVTPRSRCRSCGRRIRLRDLVPILSFLVLRGSCRDCGARISFRYPVVEFLGMAIVIWAVTADWSDLPRLALRVFFPGMLLALAVTDFERWTLPDRITFSGFAAGLGFSLSGVGPSFPEAVLGALLGGGSLLLLRWFYQLTRGVEGMGLGDIKMTAMVGVFLGPSGIIWVIGLGSGLALVTMLPLLLAGRISRTTPIPFGVFLAAASALVFVAGESAWILL